MLKIQTNPTLADDFTKEYSDRVLKRLIKVLNSGLYKRKTKTTIKLSKSEKKVLVKFADIKTINYLLSAEPKKLREYIEHVSNYYPIFHNKNSNIYKILYNVFVSSGYENIDKFKFIKDIGLKSCAYCNRSYIYTINKNKNLKPEIDHFYPKHLYPYLAMSYYNLIPSCPTCNGFGAKGTKDSYKDNLKNPYEIESDDFKFTFDIKSINIIDNKIDEDSVEIKLKKSEKTNNKYFQLENLYKEHKDIAIELYQKLYQENTKEHFESLESSLRGLKFDEDEVYRLMTCGYKDESEHHKRPLSKLIKDISQELELI